MVAGDIVFLVQASYHLDDALATCAELPAHGLRGSVILPVGPTGALRSLRTTTTRLLDAERHASIAGFPPGSPLSTSQIIQLAAMLVVRNDWGPSRTIVEAAISSGVPTVGWVEGVQDFDDVDTGRARRAYRHVDRAFSLGEYDHSLLAAEVPTDIVGSERLWQRWRGQPTTARLPLLGNVNFTYGVRRGDRRKWTEDLIRSARRADIDLVISRHPADRGWRGRSLEAAGGSDVLLPGTARLVSRFSTAIYDALALGVDVVYHNPHDEQVPTFRDAGRALTITSSRSDLTAALLRPVPTPELVRQRASDFLHHHLQLGGERPAALAARLLAEHADR